MKSQQQKMIDLLSFLYGDETGADSFELLTQLMAVYQERLPKPKTADFSPADAILITYGDMVQETGKTPLRTLAEFCQQTLNGAISAIHILPFYPYSSDDGFSVIDYRAVNPDLGNWDDVLAVGKSFELMFDAVINHISAKSEWFNYFLQDEVPYTDYFKVVSPEVDLTAVFRPRALPLLTEFQTPSGSKHVWTTFSADQIDLNYESPALLLEVVEVLLDYVAKGATLVRLDAIGFMWKVPGTTSIHLPQTHAIIQLMRLVLQAVAPQVKLITETNVPHQDNISYFGNGTNEAQMVYNFSLPPLTLHSIHTGNATALTQWAQSSLDLPSSEVTFFNFLASHDGIGVTPARGILQDAEIEAMAARVEALGGFVSYKNNGDGSQSAYELNISYIDALGVPNEDANDALRAGRYLAAQAIMLALRGVPGIYFHSLFGSRGWLDGVAQTGRNRTINREKLSRTRLEADLAEPEGLRALVLQPSLQMLTVRQNEPAFHPTGEQEVLSLNTAVFAVRRHVSNSPAVLCLTNVSNNTVTVVWESEVDYVNILTEEANCVVAENGRFTLTLAAYQSAWLREASR